VVNHKKKNVFKIDANVRFKDEEKKDEGLTKGQRRYLLCVFLFIENNFVGKKKKFGDKDHPNFKEKKTFNGDNEKVCVLNAPGPSKTRAP